MKFVSIFLRMMLAAKSAFSAPDDTLSNVEKQMRG